MPNHSFSSPGLRGFTLVELLAVLVVLAILVTLGWGAASGGIAKARATACLTSMRQVGAAVQMYAADHGDRLPDTSHLRTADGNSLSWTVTLDEYLGDGFMGKCPCNRDSPAAVTYGWNDGLVETGGEGIPFSRCRTPAATMMLGESVDGYTSEHFHFASARSRITYNQFKSSVSVDRHGSHAHYLFVDGHVEGLTPLEIKSRLNATDSTFLKP